MKRFSCLLISFVFIMSAAVLASSGQDSSAAGIKFEHGNWADITARAKKENKIIFLDAFASWCGPCKWMAKNVFTDAKVGDLFNEKFVCAKIDMEKGEGNDLRKKFGVMAFPTFLYISPDGETIIHRTCGSTPAETFIQNGLNALDPEKQLFT
ncbi:MAG: thioredoxin family protein, partial [Syntrophothermus sp.]